jgi:CRAL/TRIO domain
VFQLLKQLLPKKVVERMKTINSKTVRQYIDENNMPHEWGGKDNYEFSFEPESVLIDSDDGRVSDNNNDSIQVNYNELHSRKVGNV